MLGSVKKHWKITLSVCSFIFSMLATGCATPDLGSPDYGLKPCPTSPNCVSSSNTDSKHHVAPFVFTGDRGKAFNSLAEILDKMENVKIITQTDNYLHAEFTSQIFRFKDDVEFWLPDKTVKKADRVLEGNLSNAKVIHLRSASRLGYSDFGVNRERCEMLRKLFKKAVEGDDRE